MHFNCRVLWALQIFKPQINVVFIYSAAITRVGTNDDSLTMFMRKSKFIIIEIYWLKGSTLGSKKENNRKGQEK